MNSFTIKIESTPNKNILKFTANHFLTNSESYEFKNIDETKSSPLSQQLFHFPFIKAIYIAQNFIAIEKFSIVEWEDVQKEVAETIENYLNTGAPVVEKKDDVAKKIPLTVYAEITPNPSVMKFVANKRLFNDMFEFKSIDDTKNAPLAQALFHFPFVKEVFFSDNYISVSKYDIAEWEDITLELREFIKSHIEEGKPILNDAILQEKEEKATENNVELSDLKGTPKEIVNILNEYIKPAVAGDGGNIAFKSYDEHSQKVEVILQGACSGCPSSTFTLKNGIETMLKEMLPGKVQTVEALNG